MKKNKRTSRRTRKKEFEINVTSDAIEEYSKDIQELIQKLYVLTLEDLEKAIIKIREAIESYPEIPQFYNYLFVCYNEMGDFEKAISILETTRRKFPDYLFAKTNYAQLLLGEKKYSEIPKIFNNYFDLKLLYPERDTFHVTEVMSFFYVMGRYFIGINRLDIAKKYASTMNDIDPDDAMSKDIEYLLFHYENHPGEEPLPPGR
ncbi:MAG: hypothetical protein GY754_05180 [bacterium]|nr:hypothetical protein [bacterium]